MTIRRNDLAYMESLPYSWFLPTFSDFADLTMAVPIYTIFAIRPVGRAVTVQTLPNGIAGMPAPFS